MVLSDKAQNGTLFLIDALTLSTPKTKEAAGLLSRLPLTGVGGRSIRVGVVLPAHSPELSRSMRNIPNVIIFSPSRLNIVELLKCKKVVAPLKSIDEIVTALGGEK